MAADLVSYRTLTERDRRDMVAAGRGADGAPYKVHPLDTEASILRLRKIESWLENERDRQAVARYQMALDEDFYDGLQIDDEDAAIIVERGQMPYVYNRIKPSVDWLTGTEKRTRIDYRVYPRSSNDRNDADNKTKLFKYVDDVNAAAYARSRAFEDSVKVGVGWLECGLRGDPTAELVYDRYESWRNMLYDSYAVERDQSDARYNIRRKWLDEDVAVQAFPDRANIIRSVATTSDIAQADDAEEWYLGRLLTERNDRGERLNPRVFADSTALFNKRDRVCVYEMWYRMPERVPFVVGGAWHGTLYNPQDEILNWWIQKEQAVSVIERVTMRVYACVFVRGHFLANVPSPYRHNQFPFTPIWGNRRGRDGSPYGMVRAMRDPQEDFNKRMSKAIYTLSTRRVVMDKGAVDDVEELREEVARPDSVIVKKPNTSLEIFTDTEIAEEHLKFAQLDAQQIEVGGGVTDELMGRRTNAVSGKAIEARQDQGSTVTTNYFDNYRFTFQKHGQKKLSLIEQYYTFQKSIRVIGERRGYDFIEINNEGVDQDGQPTILNDITKSQADFIVSAQDFRETIRLAISEQLMSMVEKLAQFDIKIALSLLDEVLEFNDMPASEGIIKTLREITGKRARDEQPTPEEAERDRAAKIAEEQKKSLLEREALRRVVLENNELAAKVGKLIAESEKIGAEASVSGAGAELRAKYEEQLRKVRDDTKKLIDALTDQMRKAQNDLNNKTYEIDKKYITDVETARIKADSDAEIAAAREAAESHRESVRQETVERVAKINADGEKIVGQLEAQIEELRKTMQDATKEAKSASDEAKKAAEEAAKLAEKAAKDAETRVKEVEKASREQTAKDAAGAAPSVQPIVVPVVVGGEGDETRDLQIEFSTDAQGRIKSAKGTSKKAGKKPAAKKE